MDVTHSGKTLTINGQTVTFGQKVKQVIVLDDRVIIRLLVDDFAEGDPMVGRNILAFDAEGKMLWRVMDHGATLEADDGNGRVPQAFLALWVDDDRKTIKAGIPAFIFDLDPETGELSNPELNR